MRHASSLITRIRTRPEARGVFTGYLGAFVSSLLALIPDQGLRLLDFEMLVYVRGHFLLVAQT